MKNKKIIYLTFCEQLYEQIYEQICEQICEQIKIICHFKE